MKDDKVLQEKFDQLQELIRKATSLISPMTYSDTLKDLRTKPAQDVFKGDFKKCVIPWKKGAQVTHLPVCNRFGMVDLQMIDFSKKLVNKLRSRDPQISDTADITLVKLDALSRKYGKESPRPQDRGAQNGQVTKFTNRIIKNIKNHLT